jgi:hypothetical protein
VAFLTMPSSPTTIRPEALNFGCFGAFLSHALAETRPFGEMQFGDAFVKLRHREPLLEGSP